jgi:hypothetical protein
MARTLEQRTHDLAVMGEMVVELAREAIDAGEMTNELVELICELEARMGRALEVGNPDQ